MRHDTKNILVIFILLPKKKKKKFILKINLIFHIPAYQCSEHTTRILEEKEITSE